MSLESGRDRAVTLSPLICTRIESAVRVLYRARRKGEYFESATKEREV